MPRGDRTGPAGMGPMTGRRAGFCAGYDAPGHAHAAPGRAFGRGGWRGYGWGGGGHGWRHRFYATGLPRWARYGEPYGFDPAWGVPPAPTLEQNLDTLKQQAAWLKDQLDAINQRIQELESE